MSRTLGKDGWKDILKEAGKDSSPYFILKDADGPIKVTFLSPPKECDEGEEDILGVKWKHDWTKVEAKAKIVAKKEKVNEEAKNKKVFSIGGTKSYLLQEFLKLWLEKDLDENDIVGTIWKIKKIGKKYKIKYVGVDEEVANNNDDSDSEDEDVDEEETDDDFDDDDDWDDKTSKTISKKKGKDEKEEKVSKNEIVGKEKKTKKSSKSKEGKSKKELNEIVDIVKELRDEPQMEEGISKNKFITAISLRGSLSMETITKYMEDLESKKLIKFTEDGVVLI